MKRVINKRYAVKVGKYKQLVIKTPEDNLVTSRLNPEVDITPHVPYNPERYLCLKIVQRAVMDMLGNDEEERKDAISWFKEEGSDYIFSFESIQAIVDLGALEVHVIKEVMNGRLPTPRKEGSTQADPGRFSPGAKIEEQGKLGGEGSSSAPQIAWGTVSIPQSTEEREGSGGCGRGSESAVEPLPPGSEEERSLEPLGGVQSGSAGRGEDGEDSDRHAP